MSLVTLTATEGPPEQHREWCERLEQGAILFFPKTPIALADEDLQFLRGQQQTDSSLHKNIAYKPKADELSGVDTKTAKPAAVDRLRSIMRGYSQSVTAFLTGFLSPYAGQWQLDYASFRPQEEEGRDLPLRRRNDLLHTDAFPTRPTHGARILRFFNNIHPDAHAGLGGERSLSRRRHEICAGGDRAAEAGLGGGAWLEVVCQRRWVWVLRRRR